MAQHKKIFLFIGPPGCGKGTQIDLLREKFREDAEFFGMGDYIREKRRQYPSFNQICIDCGMDNGVLLPDQILKEIIDEVISKFFNSKKISLFLDGYPRTLEQHQHIYDCCTIEGCDVNIIPIIFEVSDKLAIARIVTRGAISGRADDNIEKAQKRIEEYSKNIIPIINSLDGSSGVLIVGGQQKIESIHNQILDFVYRSVSYGSSNMDPPYEFDYSFGF